MINCDKDCPNRERMPHASAIRYHRAVAGICNQCRHEQLKDEDGCIEDLIEQRDGWRKQFLAAEEEIKDLHAALIERKLDFVELEKELRKSKPQPRSVKITEEITHEVGKTLSETAIKIAEIKAGAK